MHDPQDRSLRSRSTTAALRPRVVPYNRPAGGWGSVHAVESIVRQEHVVGRGARVLFQQNKPKGFACVSCSWAKPADPHLFEFCENGAKATAWEITDRRTTPDFFARHSVHELLGWSDMHLEAEGRLTHPMRYNPVTDHYEPVSWDAAFEGIAQAMDGADPQRTVFYASGRASLETSYMYALMARLFGSNNLPDSSNMCHESTSVALPETIGVPVGTVTLDDFEYAHAFFFFGHNTGTNAPRMLHPLQEAREKRHAEIVVFNPIRERGHERFANPQSPVEMLTGQATQIATQYHQVSIGGDIAAVMGIAKALLALDERAQIEGSPRVLDVDFIARHTQGFEAFAAAVHATGWGAIVRVSGLPQEDLENAARVYAQSPATMILYGMGITQHREGVLTIQMLSNLMLMKGNIGRPGAGICPIRGHSNVQGQRTVGITEKPALVPMDKLRELYHFEPPSQEGMSTVDVCRALQEDRLDAFIGLGGNFARAIPEQGVLDAHWGGVPLTVQIATKLNRSHLLVGRQAYLLPCLGRIEIDRQASGAQTVSVEDSTACVHASDGMVAPASEHLLSEPAIVARLARALLPADKAARVPWDDWVADYSRVREAIERTYPTMFERFNERMRQPGGFHRPLATAQRVWNTPSGKACFVVPNSLDTDEDMDYSAPDTLRLMTTRGDSQFNTTVYALDDRFRGVFDTRDVILMNAQDMQRLGLSNGDRVQAQTVAGDGVKRSLDGLSVHAFDIPAGCAMGYYPECNRLIPLEHHAKRSKVPAAKSIPVRLVRTGAAPKPSLTV